MRNHQSKARLEVHHIDGNPLNNALENLVTLCNFCHRDEGHAASGGHAK
jgi:5-methylcytosine-specific restriction endonuclease McrA